MKGKFADRFAVGIIDDDKVEKRAKSTTSARDKDFRQLFVALRSHHEMTGLASTIKYLDDAQYLADAGKLKQILI